MTDFERLGGETAVARLIRALVEREEKDFIVGFLFQGRDLERVIRHETAFAVAHLGGPNAYQGRPLHKAHAPLRINRGHFRRRLAILRTVLQEHEVPEDIIERWLAHDARFVDAVTNGTDCVD